ncbi:uncharacterized protein TRAVEDRAFT_22583 [Trametes versicolor FP-101664 SS1]|uniref:uncharacterized protein n=1 Tax=Trametes versicolor (strain FP-101664) TaxID=717944 RepID=UPI000462347D|nr:uncharacterized protein TRAVEDRAFT_22583 [Trametes versicolor FP-101664 SS1]EIW54655.1 hypothetical protein TRAVEDRAFT_22583 [Trametes versicolor FP-101664 SS1]
MSNLYGATLGPSPEDCVLINSTLNSTSSTSALERDIEQLRNNIDTINDLFQKVSRPLQKFDHEYFKDLNASGALAPQWVSFRKIAHAVVYSGAVLGKVREVNCNVAALVAEIQIFQGVISSPYRFLYSNNISPAHQKVQAQIVMAKRVRDSFNNIANDIKEFKRKVEITVGLESPSGALSEDMSNAFENMNVVENKVARGSTYMGTVASFAPRVARTLCTIAPTIAFQALQCLFVVPEAAVSVDPDLAARMELSKSRALENIGNVGQRIEAIANIWHSLRVDMLCLETDLSLCGGSENVTSTAWNSQFLMPKIEASITVCKLLVKCLSLYVSQATLQKADVFPGSG